MTPPRKWSNRDRAGMHVPTKAQREWNGRGFGGRPAKAPPSESWWVGKPRDGFTKQAEARVFSGTEANSMPREL